MRLINKVCWFWGSRLTHWYTHTLTYIPQGMKEQFTSHFAPSPHFTTHTFTHHHLSQGSGKTAETNWSPSCLFPLALNRRPITFCLEKSMEGTYGWKRTLIKTEDFFILPMVFKDQVTIPLQVEYLILYHGNVSQLHQVQCHHIKVVVCQITETNDGQQQCTQRRRLRDQKIEPVSTSVSREVCADCCCQLQL